MMGTNQVDRMFMISVNIAVFYNFILKINICRFIQSSVFNSCVIGLMKNKHV